MRDISIENVIIDADEIQKKKISKIIDADYEYSQILARAIMNNVVEMKEQSPIIECL